MLENMSQVGLKVIGQFDNSIQISILCFLFESCHQLQSSERLSYAEVFCTT